MQSNCLVRPSRILLARRMLRKPIAQAWLAASLSVALTPGATAEPVHPSRAATVANQWYALRFRDGKQPGADWGKPRTLITAEHATALVVKGRKIGFAFDIAGDGSIVIAADDALPPVLYYSLRNRLTVPAAQPAQAILEAFADTIARLQGQPFRKTSPSHPLWATLEADPTAKGAFEIPTSSPSAPTGPLLTSIWHQSKPYNGQCPIYQGERCLTGCVATAMAQLMHYWKHPAEGSGSHSYYWSLGGKTLSAEFGSTTYDWSSIPDEVTATSPQVMKDAVSTLCYHCGVSVNSEYSPHGTSGSVNGRSLTKYFGYNYTRMVKRANYSDREWYDLMRSQIDRHQPVLYKIKYGESNHMAVLDGYDDPDLVHLNMGLGGSLNGWYATSYSSEVSDMENWATVDIRPHDHPTNYYVNGTTGNDDWDGTAPVWRGETQGPKKTIQAGIYAAGPGDTVIVADGIYTGPGNIDLDLGDRLITVRSANGPANCIIDCQGAGRGLHFGSGATELATIGGLTIRNGKADNGGGIFCWYGKPTIINCVITGNTATEVGGGLYGCCGLIQNCVIAGNSARFGGGLAFCDGVIQDSVISQNTAAEQVGGGLYDCGGIIQNNTISANSARWGGGLGYCNGAIRNNMISANMSTDRVGGGLCECNGKIENNTITGNSAPWGAGLGYCDGTIQNCIIWGNTVSYGAQLYDSATPIYSCIQDWTAGGKGNVPTDPQFVHSAGADYRLSLNSPCIDAGNSEEWMWDALDLDGNPRIWCGKSSLSVDMGAYERGSFQFRIVGIPKASSGGTEVTWSSRPGDTYTIWSCFDLDGVSWNEEATIPSGGNSTTWIDTDTTSTRKFYKIELK